MGLWLLAGNLQTAFKLPMSGMMPECCLELSVSERVLTCGRGRNILMHHHGSRFNQAARTLAAVCLLWSLMLLLPPSLLPPAPLKLLLLLGMQAVPDKWSTRAGSCIMALGRLLLACRHNSQDTISATHTNTALMRQGPAIA